MKSKKPRLYIFISAVTVSIIAILCAATYFYIPHISEANNGNSRTVESTPQKTSVTGSSTVAGDSSPKTQANNDEISQPSDTSDKSAAQNGSQKTAYLTFDDGPSELTPELLDILNDCNIHATFFVVGVNAQNYPDTLKQIVGDGNMIGVHSWTHQYSYIYKNTENFLDDFNKLKNYIEKTTGVMPSVCRFPGGTNNTVCLSYNKDHIMKNIVALVENMGFTYYDWNVSSGEANADPPSKEEIVKSVVSQCKEKNTAVILFHDTDNQDYVDAIPEIVSQLRAMGFTFHTLSPDDPPSSKASVAQFRPS